MRPLGAFSVGASASTTSRRFQRRSFPPFVSELPTLDIFVHTGAVRSIKPVHGEFQNSEEIWRYAMHRRPGHEPLRLDIIRGARRRGRASPRVQRHTSGASDHGSQGMEVAGATGAMRRGNHGQYRSHGI